MTQCLSSIVDINSRKILFDPFIFSVNKFDSGCNIIDEQCAWICVSNKVKNIHAKVFNLLSGANETKFLAQHELCECKCRLNESVCNSKQKWNHNECRCEYI